MATTSLDSPPPYTSTFWPRTCHQSLCRLVNMCSASGPGLTLLPLSGTAPNLFHLESTLLLLCSPNESCRSKLNSSHATEQSRRGLGLNPTFLVSSKHLLLVCKCSCHSDLQKLGTESHVHIFLSEQTKALMFCLSLHAPKPLTQFLIQQLHDKPLVK